MGRDGDEKQRYQRCHSIADPTSRRMTQEDWLRPRAGGPGGRACRQKLRLNGALLAQGQVLERELPMAAEEEEEEPKQVA